MTFLLLFLSLTVISSFFFTRICPYLGQQYIVPISHSSCFLVCLQGYFTACHVLPYMIWSKHSVPTYLVFCAEMAILSFITHVQLSFEVIPESWPSLDPHREVEVQSFTFFFLVLLSLLSFLPLLFHHLPLLHYGSFYTFFSGVVSPFFFFFFI